MDIFRTVRVFLQRSFPCPDPLLSVLRAEWHAGAAAEVTFLKGWVGVVCAIRARPGRRGVRGVYGTLEVRLCHLESPALVRNVRPLRAQIMYWMRPLYF